MRYKLIEDFISLQTLCQQYSEASVLAIDTEFVRTRTYYPKLGLLQIFDGKTLALIDPVVITDLSPFWQLLTNKKIVKVLHACSEDLEVFLTNGDCKPVNLLDSQIMMSFLGHGLSMGYAAMVEHFTDIQLDKSESRTDWIKRPLTVKQLDYASADVEHLFHIYPKLVSQLEQAGWLEYAQQETQLLIERKFSVVDEELLYSQMKLAWRLNAKQLNNLKHLVKWRYQQAKKRDLPLSFVVKENTLMAIAVNNPGSLSAMNRLDGAEVMDIRHKGKDMLAILQQASQVDKLSYPVKIQRLDEYPGYKQTFKQVKTFITSVSEKHNLAIENCASKKQINQFLTWHFDLNGAKKQSENTGVYPDILSVWRNELFGESLKVFAENNFKSL